MPVDFIIPRDAVVAGLRTLWPGAEMLPERSQMHDVGCVYRGTELWVSRGASGLTVDGDLDFGFEAVTWFRSIVPDHLVVIVSDPDYSYSAEVPPGVTIDALRTLVANSGGAITDA
ncbi:hypothetical protein [Isoptericola sp. NPDC056578]|uniref:hypothetical protein n=1 Tax=unclassified Isoptericola TaxID=2623355 RepID=UPI00367FA6CF